MIAAACLPAGTAAETADAAAPAKEIAICLSATGPGIAMREENVTEESRDALTREGYSPCGNCKP